MPSAANQSRSYVFDDDTQFKVSGKLIYHGTEAGAMEYSPDGAYLAIGDDQGILVIHETIRQYRQIKAYKTGAKIRSIVWHPSISRAILVGSANGNVDQLLFSTKGADITSSGSVPGFIHAMALSPDGAQLAVAFGRSVVLVEQVSFGTWDSLNYLRTYSAPRLESTEIENATIGRNIHFLDKETLLVAYFGRVGIIAYTTIPPYDELWRIDTRPGTWVGSSSLSPSRKKLAVTNLFDGIDWYSIPQKQHTSTTRYPIGSTGHIVGLAFIDEKTLVAGHVDGHLVIANSKMRNNPHVIEFPETKPLTQLVSCGIVGGKLHITAANGARKNAKFVLITDGSIEKKSATPKFKSVRLQLPADVEDNRDLNPQHRPRSNRSISDNFHSNVTPSKLNTQRKVYNSPLASPPTILVWIVLLCYALRWYDPSILTPYTTPLGRLPAELLRLLDDLMGNIQSGTELRAEKRLATVGMTQTTTHTIKETTTVTETITKLAPSPAASSSPTNERLGLADDLGYCAAATNLHIEIYEPNLD